MIAASTPPELSLATPSTSSFALLFAAAAATDTCRLHLLDHPKYEPLCGRGSQGTGRKKVHDE
jgi:hypothetical protein